MNNNDNNNLPNKKTSFLDKIKRLFLAKELEELAQIKTELDKREAELDARETGLEEREARVKAQQDDLTKALGAITTEGNPIKGEKRVQVEARKKEFIEEILKQTDDLTDNIHSLEKSEKTLNTDLSDRKKNIIREFKVKMLGLLSIYIDRDEITLSSESQSVYREVVDNTIEELLNEEPSQKEKLTQIIIETIIPNIPGYYGNNEVADIREDIKESIIKGEIQGYSPVALLNGFVPRKYRGNTTLDELRLYVAKSRGGEYAPEIFNAYKEIVDTKIKSIEQGATPQTLDEGSEIGD